MKTFFQKFFLSKLNYFQSSLLPIIFKTYWLFRKVKQVSLYDPSIAYLASDISPHKATPLTAVFQMCELLTSKYAVFSKAFLFHLRRS